ncbi:MAG: hypothetical protein K9M15_01905 [Candidatus Marinimicrobia bacterium]|nr:hypothetical protein [Candidatus Neomarinimicrobiota bacterium]
MAKKIIRDIITKKQTPRVNSPVKNKERKEEIVLKKESQKSFLNKNNWTRKEKQIKTKSPKRKKGKAIFAMLIFTLMIILGIKTLNILAKTVVQLIVHKEVVSVDTAIKLGKSGSFDLPLETIEIQGSKQKTIKATGVEEAETKASGQIVIYNSYSSKNQTLIATTRFETPEGKIYRINKSVVVPGAKVDGGSIVPSSIEVTVYADEPGEEYNIGLTDFTIPGFKGDSRYEKFYARSKTEMTGGFKGEVPTISNEDFLKIKKELQASLKEELIKKAKLQTPDDFLLHTDTINVTFLDRELQNSIYSQDNNKMEFVIEEKATLFAPLFSKNKLSEVLAGKYLGEDFKNTIKIVDPAKLTFELISGENDANTMIFKLVGEIEFVWLIDEEKLKEALIASAKEDSSNIFGIFSEYPSIDSASVIFKPSWWKFFPNSSRQILIEIK